MVCWFKSWKIFDDEPHHEEAMGFYESWKAVHGLILGKSWDGRLVVHGLVVMVWNGRLVVIRVGRCLRGRKERQLKGCGKLNLVERSGMLVSMMRKRRLVAIRGGRLFMD